MQKGFGGIIILFFVLLLMVGVGASTFYFKNHYLQKQSEIKNVSIEGTNEVPIAPTENIFKNNELGFEFKVPDGFSVKEETEEEFHTRSNGNIRKNFTSYVKYAPTDFITSLYVLNKQRLPSTEVVGKDTDFENAPLSVWVSENPRDLGGKDFYKDYWYYPYVWGDFSTAEKNKFAPNSKEEIGRLPALSGIASKSPGSPKFIYLAKDGKMFLFRVVGDTKILDSFKFIDSTKNAGWEKFESADSLYSLEYPSNWKIDEKTGCGGPEISFKGNKLNICSYDGSGLEKIDQALTKNKTLVSEKEIMLAGVRAIKKVVKIGQEEWIYILAEFDKNEQPLVVSVVYSGTEKATLEKIVDSFKLL